MKKAYIVTAVVTGITLAGALGFAVDRPVLYNAEFVPIADEVYELVAEKTGDQLQRAKEQVLSIEDWNEKMRAKGKKIEQKDVQSLRYWQQRVRELDRKLKKLDK